MTDISTETTSIPIVPLRGGAVFPGLTTTISIGRRRSLAAAQAALEQGGEMMILVQYKAEVDNPEQEDLVSTGILATIRDILRSPHVGVQMLVELHRRVDFTGLDATEPYLQGGYQELVDMPDDSDEEMMNEALAYLAQYAEALGESNQQAIVNARSKSTNGQLADYIAGLFNIPFDTELELLSTLDGTTRLEIILLFLQKELRIAEIRNKIQKEAREGADKAQR